MSRRDITRLRILSNLAKLGPARAARIVPNGYVVFLQELVDDGLAVKVEYRRKMLYSLSALGKKMLESG